MVTKLSPLRLYLLVLTIILSQHTSNQFHWVSTEVSAIVEYYQFDRYGEIINERDFTFDRGLGFLYEENTLEPELIEQRMGISVLLPN